MRANQVVDLPLPRQPEAGVAEARLRGVDEVEFEPDPLPLATVSELLWAATGGRRPGSWGRSAPPPGMCQEVTAYVLLPEGAYRYEPHEHRLLLASPDDLRSCAGNAPLDLVYVVAFRPVHLGSNEEHSIAPCADIGRIVQNVSRYCGEAGLAWAIRGLGNRALLVRALGLTAEQQIALVQAVGCPAGKSPRTERPLVARH